MKNRRDNVKKSKGGHYPMLETVIVKINGFLTLEQWRALQILLTQAVDYYDIDLLNEISRFTSYEVTVDISDDDLPM